MNIPDDGKHYVLKAYVNNAETLEPYMKPAILKATNLPVVILKLDGVGVGKRYTSFVPAYEYAVENGIKMTIFPTKLMADQIPSFSRYSQNRFISRNGVRL